MQSTGRGKTALFAAIAVVVSAAAQSWDILTGWTSLNSIRLGYAFDQYGYLAVVTNVSYGHFDLSEPDTETGYNFYPRGYFTVVGLVARVLGHRPVLAWNLCGLAMEAILIATIAVALARFGRRSWLALLAPLPLLIGVFAWAVPGSPGWFNTVHRGVLWGPYGIFYSFNGETAGLCLGVSALLWLAMVRLRGVSARTRVITTTIAAIVIGSLAHAQTYCFITTVYVLCFIVAVHAIFTYRARWVGLASIITFIAVFAVGPWLSVGLGQLGTLVFGLLPAAPGLVLSFIRARFRTLPYFVLGAAVATPQIAWTLWGVSVHDPFLEYRVASNVALGVVEPVTILSSVVPILMLVGTFCWGVLTHRRVFTAISVALVVVFVLLSLNDVWGANVEPYRLWIEVFFVVCILGSVGLVAMAATLPPRAVIARRPSARRRRRLGSFVIAITLVVAVASVPDFIQYSAELSGYGHWVSRTERMRDIEKLGQGAKVDGRDALVAFDQCIDPPTAKIVSGARIAFYHLGMAWPVKYKEISAFLQARDVGVFDLAAAKRAKVQFLMVDTACPVNWQSAPGLTMVARRHYTTTPADRAYGSRPVAEGDIVLYRVG